jgi:hypothetical protein
MKNLRLAFLFATLILASCRGGDTGTYVWIDVPINNLHLSDVQPIKIEGHASNPGGVSQVEVWVNGDLIESISPTATSTNMSIFETVFSPTSPGEYVIQVIAIGSDETSSTPDKSVVQIGELIVAAAIEDESTPTPTPEIIITVTPSQVPPEDEDEPTEIPLPIVNYWADPTEITAGGCTTLYWETSNVSRVVFGGVEQEFNGSYSDCMCETQSYPLRVTHNDGTEETFRVTIDVTGTCSTDTPVPSVNYWADPTEITAGGCTTLYWETSNVSRVEFGGIDQELNGSYPDCMCETQTYPLRVTYNDGTQETFQVTINVTGICGTDTPVPDTTPPDPPTLLKPLNGTTLTCSSSTILRWDAASDPSGIDEYRVRVERHAGDNNWQAVSGSIFTGITGLEKMLSIECGWTYRWRVRAIDGQGNVGDWSGWFAFIDPLT